MPTGSNHISSQQPSISHPTGNTGGGYGDGLAAAQRSLTKRSGTHLGVLPNTTLNHNPHSDALSLLPAHWAEECVLLRADAKRACYTLEILPSKLKPLEQTSINSSYKPMHITVQQ